MKSKKLKFAEYVYEICTCVSEGRPFSSIQSVEMQLRDRALGKVESQRLSNPEMTLEELTEYGRKVVREMWAEIVLTIHTDQSRESKYDAIN